jgi:hypothetical protein
LTGIKMWVRIYDLQHLDDRLLLFRVPFVSRLVVLRS